MAIPDQKQLKYGHCPKGGEVLEHFFKEPLYLGKMPMGWQGQGPAKKFSSHVKDFVRFLEHYDRTLSCWIYLLDHFGLPASAGTYELYKAQISLIG